MKLIRIAGDESEVQDNDQFYKTGLEVGLSPGDAGGPQADFFERFLKNHSEVNDDRIRTVRYRFVLQQYCLQTSTITNAQ